jgi:sugar lactone lactonase YvrE
MRLKLPISASCCRYLASAVVLWICLSELALCVAAEPAWLCSTAHPIPKELTTEGSGYFSIIEGKNGKIYVGTAKYGFNAFLVEFDPNTKAMKTVVDCMKEIGSTATGFAAQAKIHTRNNIGESGKIYFGTKQGYPKPNSEQKRTDYPGGYPMVYDPATGKTRVYGIPVPHQGVISIAPDESRGVAYVSTCSDERPIESTHFLVLNLETGKYRDLIDARHMYAFIVIDHTGRAYHPVLGGQIARFDPVVDKLELLAHTIDGQPPSKDSHLADEQSHPINWDVSPDKQTLWAVPMSGNQLYSYDLKGTGNTLAGMTHGALIKDAKATDCRAMCVGPDGRVWMGVAATFAEPSAKRGQYLHLVSYQSGAAACLDQGPIAVKNPDFTRFTGDDGKQLPWHHGFETRADGTLTPRYTIMGICAARNGTVYVTTLAPFTLHEIKVPN